MAGEREPPSVADYAVTALSPALVMLMVGSLVFFLVEVLYAGRYTERLLYTLFFFVFAAVLVARISIQVDAGRAKLYGIVLAIVTYLALLSYVQYPAGWLKSWGWLVNLGLLALVWWSAHKLTWDCTHIDEGSESSGRGLLNAAGLDADSAENRGQESGNAVSREPKASGKSKRKKKKTKKPKHDSRLWDWIEKYQLHKESQRKGGHTPGVWVLYFALAALPLFALGQSLIDASDDKRRHATFLQMTVYIGSALGLLVTTSLLGVRRYLRQRKAKVPGAMTASWLGLGGVLIVVFLVIGAFLPRPHSEVPWFGIERAGAAKRNASKHAQLGDSAGEGDGRGGNKSKAGDGGASGKGGDPGGNKGEKGAGKGQDGKGGSGKKSDQSGGDDKGKGQGARGDTKDDSRSRDAEGRASDADPQDDAENDKADSNSRDASSQTNSQLSGALAKIAGVLKWIVFAIVAVIVILALFFGVLKYLAPFTDWARRWLEGIRAWWAGLFGTTGRARQEAAADATPQAAMRPPPFSLYSNPFSDGTADRREPEELISYTFEAFDAWAWDRDAGREPTETPLEFAHKVGEGFPDHADAFTRLANLYTRLAYSELPLPEDALAVLESVWEELVHGAGVGA